MLELPCAVNMLRHKNLVLEIERKDAMIEQPVMQGAQSKKHRRLFCDLGRVAPAIRRGTGTPPLPSHQLGFPLNAVSASLGDIVYQLHPHAESGEAWQNIMIPSSRPSAEVHSIEIWADVRTADLSEAGSLIEAKDAAGLAAHTGSRIVEAKTVPGT